MDVIYEPLVYCLNLFMVFIVRSSPTNRAHSQSLLPSIGLCCRKENSFYYHHVRSYVFSNEIPYTDPDIIVLTLLSASRIPETSA